MAQVLRSTSQQRSPSRPAPDSARAKDSVIAFNDLPPAGTRHWVPRHKAAVVAAVDAGVLSHEDAQRRYLLSEEEFEGWRDTVHRYGVVGLRMSVSERRGAARRAVSEIGMVALSANEHAECIITDVSDRGLRLEVDARIKLPHRFEVHCESSGRSWWVELVWQRGRDAGVHFANPLSPPFCIAGGLGEWLVGGRDTVTIDRR